MHVSDKDIHASMYICAFFPEAIKDNWSPQQHVAKEQSTVQVVQPGNFTTQNCSMWINEISLHEFVKFSFKNCQFG